MKKLIIIALLLTARVSCKAPTNIIQEKEVIKIEKEYIKDTIIDIQIKEMFIEKQTKDTSSELSTNNAFSRALWSNGTLYHSLEQKGVQPTKITYKEKIITDTIYQNKTEIKEVEKKLSSIQNFFIIFGKLSIVIILLLILIKIKNNERSRN